MSKARVVITVTVEYDQVPEYYDPGDQTPERMLAVDLGAAEDDPYLFMDREGVTWSITGEVMPCK